VAFTRWKQHRFGEAMEGFLQVNACFAFLLAQFDVQDQMEAMTADSPSPALFENMAHTYSSMNNYPKVQCLEPQRALCVMPAPSQAKEYFEKCLAVGTPNRTGESFRSRSSRQAASVCHRLNVLILSCPQARCSASASSASAQGISLPPWSK
jgi:hypothetical protein